MLKVYVPSLGKKEEVNLNRVKSKFFWCNCENPGLFELRRLSKKTGVSFDDLTRYRNHKKNSRIIIRKNYDIVLLKYPIYKSDKVLFKNIEFVFNKKFVITLFDGNLGTINTFAKHVKEELVGIKKADYFYFLHRLLGSLLKSYLLVLDKIELKLERIENNVLKPKANVQNLFFVKKNLLHIRKAIVANRNIFGDLQEGVSRYLEKDMISDLYRDSIQILDTEELFRDRLTSTLDLHLSSVSNKLNDIMRSFTVIASLLLIPMLISSIYGMNIRLPIQSHPNAFYTIILFMILSVMVTLLFFKVKKWI